MPTVVRGNARRAHRFARNAARDIVLYLETGIVEVQGEKVKVTSFKQAKLIKIGKLKRVIGHVKRAATTNYARMPKRYAETIATWETVIRIVQKYPSLAACRRYADR